MDRVWAVLPAAGRGKRMGTGVAKQYRLLGDRPVFVYALQVLQQSDVIEGVVLVAGAGELDYCRRVVEDYALTKVRQVVSGGRERQDSVYLGLQAVPEEVDFVAVHDAARPLLQEEDLTAVVAAARDYGAAVLAVPVKDTVKQRDEGNFVRATLPRENLWLVQTPQVFNRTVLWEAHLRARKEGFYGTDDAALVERLGYQVKLVHGSYTNIKLTTPEDLVWADALLRSRENGRQGK